MRSNEFPLSIVHLCWPAPVGGLERVVQGLATWTARAGHRVTVLALSSHDGDLSGFKGPLEREGIPLIEIKSSARRYLRERRRVRHVLSKLAPDILHIHGYRCDLLHGGTARRLGITTVSTLHGSSRLGGLSHLFEWSQERALAHFDGVVAVSEPLAQSLRARGVAAEKIHLIPNGWIPPNEYLTRGKARKELNVPADCFVIGWIGRLIHVKGCDVFLAALAKLEQRDFSLRGIVVGDGPERAALEEQARALGIEDRVTFTGSIPEASRVVRAFDLFVLSSRSEGTPLTLLEVMAAEVPIVATAVGGVEDVLDPPRAGWIVPPQDASTLAQVLEEVIPASGRRSRRAVAAKKRVSDLYRPSAWVEKHLAAYRAAGNARIGRT